MVSKKKCFGTTLDEDSADGFTKAALLHKHGKCDVEDVDSGMGITATHISD
jgi:hypothetical protein